MRIAVLSETDPVETRVAATPETVKKLQGARRRRRGRRRARASSAGLPDADYEAAGADDRRPRPRPLGKADILFKVRRPSAEEIAALKSGAIVVAIIDPYGQEAALQALAEAKARAFAMEFVPRITRAQVMDVLSSQANLAGYRAVIEGAAEYGRAMPMMMTAAGTVPAAKVFVMGVGVAGLQAIATARRLGAVVTATDVRPATKEQVEVARRQVPRRRGRGVQEGPDRRRLRQGDGPEYQAKQAELVASHIAKQDIVITTALIPGRPAPKPGHRDRWRHEAGLGDRRSRGRAGRQRRGRKPGETVHANGVKIVGASQPARPHRRRRLGALRPQPVRLRRAPARQGRQARARLGGRDPEGRVPDPGRRRRPPCLPADRRNSRHRLRDQPCRSRPNKPSSSPGTRPPLRPAQARQSPPGHRRPDRQGLVATATARRGRSHGLPARDLRAGDLRRLLRGLVGDARPAHAADGGDQRHLLGDHRRRAAGGGGARVDGRAATGVWVARASASSRPCSPAVNIFGGFLVTQRMLAMYKKKGVRRT